jgi:hypothetical protein
MSKKPVALVALACAGACTIPLALPLLAGAGLATAGGGWLNPNLELIACGVLAALATALLLRPQRKPASQAVANEGASCPADASCGCRPKA